MEWSYPHKQHTQYGRLAIRLRVGRACGRFAMLMMKLSSVVCASSAGVGSGGGWSCCWMRLRRRPNVRWARSGRAGLRQRSLLSMICSCSSVSVGSMYLMLSMWGNRGTWSKNDGVGQLQIFWWIWKAARRRSFQALSTKVVVMIPKFLRVFIRRELAIGERHGLFLRRSL